MLFHGLLGARASAKAGHAGQAAQDGDQTPPEALFFVHIPKCAGSSFRQTLRRWFGQGALFLDTHDAGTLEESVERLDDPPRAIAGHIPFGLHAGLPLRPCYVSLVRHPLDRFVSLYKHARRTPEHSLHPAAARLDLEAFYDFSLNDARARGSTVAVQCYFLSGERSFEAARAVIDKSYALLAPVERYGEFVAACAERFGCQPPEIPARNVGEESPQMAEALEALGQRIKVDHAQDLSLFTYVGETFDARRASLCFALHV
ncbi:MAG TPA: sulfotransferase family 2 domain-containing protein [Caulobacteraceae bacterium]|jgi:hypothetical protein|nr:sulfotransferase family 2 domain-containing protein [Caulobacteraceae bacterium]